MRFTLRGTSLSVLQHCNGTACLYQEVLLGSTHVRRVPAIAPAPCGPDQRRPPPAPPRPDGGGDREVPRPGLRGDDGRRDRLGGRGRPPHLLPVLPVEGGRDLP